jgi:hypothetical protein
MIGKIPKPGKSFGGCIQYNLLKKGAVILDADGVRIDKIAHTIADFNMQRKMNPALGQAVGHIALSWSPNDKDRLSEEKMVSIAKEYLQGMKIQDTQVLVVRHTDRNHPHVHIVYNRVNNEGKTISDAFQHRQNIKICKALTLKHGLYLSQGKEQVNRQQLKGIDQLKYELYDTIKSVSQKVSSMDELKQKLQKQGIGMLYKYKSGTREIQGISFSKGQYKFKGSEIDRNLSYGKLSHGIEQRLKQEQQRDLEHRQLVDQLKQVVKNRPKETQNHHLEKSKGAAASPLETLLKPEYEDYQPRIEKKKKRHPEQEQSRGMHL